MCLAAPHVIIKFTDDKTAMAKAGAVIREIRTDLLKNLKEGDTVLVHAGFAIEKISITEGEELSGLWDKIRELAGEL